MKKRIIALLCAGFLLLTACGGQTVSVTGEGSSGEASVQAQAQEISVPVESATEAQQDESTPEPPAEKSSEPKTLQGEWV